MSLPPQFADTVGRVFGDRGREWLPRLPGIIAACRTKWGLRASAVCPDLSMNYLEFATRPDGEPVALKIGVPHAELFTEMETLRLYDGRGAVRLLDADRDLGAMLLERLQPGTMLRDLGDDRKQTSIAAGVMATLPVPPPSRHDLPRFAEWVERAFRLTRTAWDPEERMPRDLLDAAEAALRGLERGSGGDVVLHGDLHHENILFDRGTGWTAIDPKGVIGPASLEVGRFLHNQLPIRETSERRAEMVTERVAVLSAELGYGRETIAASGLVDCVLSHCWSFEDEGLGEGWSQGVALAWHLRDMAGMASAG